jgi:hypothetical protein
MVTSSHSGNQGVTGVNVHPKETSVPPERQVSEQTLGPRRNTFKLQWHFCKESLSQLGCLISILQLYRGAKP